jgi:hypothetical protein
MPSERVQRQIDRLLDEAEAAVRELNWTVVRDRARAVLAFDSDNVDAKAFLEAAQKGLGASPADARGGVAGPSSMAESAKVSPPLPTSFVNGRYAVKRMLGEGGKKRVYLTHDTLLDRDVAFALIKTEGLDEAGKQRILREAQVMARLSDHPHIMPVYDLGEESGQPYMVLPLMPGGDVEGVIRKAPDHKVPLEKAIQLTIQVCQGLEFAHEKGIIHRDLKPGNVWLANDGTAKIGDFGLAVAVDRSRLTQAGMMVGTVAYMPPEQALGGEVTAKADLYSLGAMLYELVTGRPPFVGDDSVAIITQHLNTPPVSPTWHHPQCPKGVEALILRLLEKDASKRPASAKEVREILEAIKTALSSSAGPPATGGAPSASAPDLVTSPLYRRTFVGREAELRQLKAAFEAAVSGDGSLIMVVGEPGIGKTAVTEQLGTYVAMRGGKALTGHCYEEGSSSRPYLAFIEALRAYVVQREPTDLSKELGAGAADVARIVSEIRDRVAVEPRAPGDPEDDRWHLLEAVTGFLRNASSVQPLLVILEDLHWADRGTLDLLLHVSRNLHGARLMVVGTYRDIEVDRAHPLSSALAELRRGAAFQRVLLRGLDIPEVQKMLTAIAGQDVPSSLAEAVHRQTEGNPLFIQEVVRYLVEEGLLTKDQGRGSAASLSNLTMQIPEGLREVIGKRLSRLSPECNRLLAIAAVIGRDFDLGVLQAVANGSEDAVITALEEAVRVGVLQEQASGGQVRYRFEHAFFRQTLYEELSAPRRIRMHQQVARALEARYAARLDEHATELMEHFAHSSDLEDLAKAVSYGESAARRSITVSAYAEAVRLLDQVLDVQEVLDPDDKVKRCDLLLALGEALMSAGQHRRVGGGIAEQAFLIGQTVADPARVAQACRLGLWSVEREQGISAMNTPEFREWVERAEVHVPKGIPGHVYVLLGKAQVHWGDHQWKYWKSLTTEALQEARSVGEPEALFAAARSGLAGTIVADSFADIVALAEEFSTKSRDGVSVRTLVTLLQRSAIVFLASGQRSRAEQAQAELREVAKRTRHADAVLMEPFMDCVLAAVDGRLDDCIRFGQDTQRQEQELGGGLRTGSLPTITAIALQHLGRADEALGNLTEARMNESLLRGRFLHHRVQALARAGRSSEARQELHDVLIEYGLGPEQSGYPLPIALTLLLDTALVLGDKAAARILRDGLASVGPLATGYFIPLCPLRFVGEASLLLGEPDTARRCYEQALEVCAKVRFRPEIALTRFRLAELIFEHYPAQRPEAVAHLDFAIKEFHEMKMQPSLELALRHKGLLNA